MIKEDMFIKIRIGSDLFRRLCRRCDQQGLKRSAVIRSLIEAWLAALCLVFLISCSRAKADEIPDMPCHPLSIGDDIGHRCESMEAVCYVLKDSISCIKK